MHVVELDVGARGERRKRIDASVRRGREVACKLVSLLAIGYTYRAVKARERRNGVLCVFDASRGQGIETLRVNGAYVICI